MGSGANANLVLMAAFLSLGMALMGLSFGPMSALLARTLSHKHALHGLRRRLQPGIDPGRGPHAVRGHLARPTARAGSVGLYLALLGIVSLVALFISKETKFTNLDTMQTEVATTGIESTSP